MAKEEPKVIWLYSEEETVTSLKVDPEGIIGSKYHGAFVKAGVREPHIPESSVIKNRRQITALDINELTELTNLLKLPFLSPVNLRPDIIFSGIPRLTQLPPGTMLHFSSGVSLEVEGFNDPCSKPAKYIVEEHPQLEYETFKKEFKSAAQGRRGIIASVYSAGEGVINLGDKVEIEEYKPQPIKIYSI